MHNGIAVRRRKLGAELRRLRSLTGLTSGEAARLMGWHQSKVSRIETGRSGLRPSDAERLLDAYGVTDDALRTLLTALCGRGARGARTAARREWWHAYGELLPPAYRDFLSLEAEAAHARTLETMVVPGLLQTPDYARAATAAALTGLPQEKIDALVEVRIARQSVLRGSRPLEVSAVLDEAVLRRPVGGPEVMAAQVRHLLEMSRLPHIRLQIMPFSAGPHIGITGPFVILSFPLTPDLDVVVLDHLVSSLHLARKEELRAYGDAFATLRADALPYAESREVLARFAGLRRDDGSG